MTCVNECYQVAVPKLAVLSDAQFEIIYGSALEVASKIGLRIQHEGLLSALKKAGCMVENDIVFFPPKLVERCLASAPKEITIYDRNGNAALKLNRGKAYFGTGVGATTLLTDFNGKRRPFTKQDIVNAAVIQDALPNLDFVMGVGEITDVNDVTNADLHQFHALLCNTTKPINFMATSARSTREIIKLAAIVAGGEHELKKKPFVFLFGVGPTPPLRYVQEKMERFCIAVDSGLPVVCISAAATGGTAPVTLAGHVVMSLAENLAAIVMAQTRIEGAPVIVGGMPLTMDMKTAAFCYGAPEFHLANAAISEALCRLNLPSYGTGGVTDSQTLDEQAAVESAVSSYFQVLSRTDLIHDVGLIDSVRGCSYESLVINDEIIAMIRRFCRGFQIDHDHLALDTIAKVGYGGNFIQEVHTLKHFKTELWRPALFNRECFANWCDKGSMPLREKARERVREILETHKPVRIDPAAMAEISVIVGRWS